MATSNSSDTFYIVINLPDGGDTMNHMTTVARDIVGVAGALDNVLEAGDVYLEHGIDGTHPHLNLIVQFRDRIRTDRLLSYCRTATGLFDITCAIVYNLDNLVRYCTKEDNHVYRDLLELARESRESTSDSSMDTYGRQSSRKRQRMDDQETEQEGSKRAKLTPKEEMMREVETLLMDGMTSFAVAEQHFYRKGGPVYRAFTANMTAVRTHVQHFNKMNNRERRKREIETLPYQTYRIWWESMQCIGKHRGMDLLRRFCMLLEPRDRVADGCTAIVMKGPPRCGKTWSTAWLERLHNSTNLRLKENGVGKHEDILHNNTVVFDDPEPRDWLDDRPFFANICTGDPISMKVYASTQQLEKPVHVLIKCNETPFEVDDPDSMIGRRLDVYHFKQFDVGEPYPTEYNHALVISYLKNSKDHLMKGRVPCCCAAIYPESEWCFVREKNSEVRVCNKKDEVMQEKVDELYNR